MSYYLLDNPNPYTQQYMAGRRGPFTGGVLIHTTESPKGNGAEPICRWIATQRRDYGSYHCVVDADGAIPMAPDDFETWHCAARHFNQRTWGISIAGRSTDLNPDDEWTKRVFHQLAAQIVAMWQRNGIDPAAQGFRPAEQLLEGPGLANHGDAQPWDRSDAFARHPRRGELEALLLSEIAAIIGPPPPEPEEDEVKPVIIKDPRPNGRFWHVCGNTRYRLESPDEVDVLRFLGVPLITEGGDGLVSWLRACKDLGRPAGN